MVPFLLIGIIAILLFVAQEMRRYARHPNRPPTLLPPGSGHQPTKTVNTNNPPRSGSAVISTRSEEQN